MTAVIQLKVEGSALPEVTERLREHKQMISVYEVTGDYDIIAVGKFTDTDGMNAQIKELLTDADIRESNTSVVLNAVTENEQFDLDLEGVATGRQPSFRSLPSDGSRESEPDIACSNPPATVPPSS